MNNVDSDGSVHIQLTCGCRDIVSVILVDHWSFTDGQSSVESI